MRIYPSTKIYIAQSKIHGLGVFADRVITEGEIIEETPLFDIGMHPGEASFCVLHYRFNWPHDAGDSWTKQVIAGGFGSFYNHSANNNAAWRSNLEKGTFEFVALRHILMDEEITVCYGGDNYWNDGRNYIEVK